MGLLRACIAETIGTFLIVLFGTGAVALAVLIDVLISLFEPLTQGGWNPARDFDQRIVAYFAV